MMIMMMMMVQLLLDVWGKISLAEEKKSVFVLAQKVEVNIKQQKSEQKKS